MNMGLTKQMYTIWIQREDSPGATYITSVDAPDTAEAVADALMLCAADWGRGIDVSGLRVLGIADGDVNIIEWNDVE